MRTHYAYIAILAGLFYQINPTVYGSASLLEIVWTLANAYGSFRTIGNLRDAQKQLRAARSEPVDVLSVNLAQLDVVIQVALFAFQFAMLAIGVIALFTPPPLVPAVATLSNAIATVLLIGGSFLLTGLSEYIARKRKRILSMLPDYTASVEGRSRG